jgi:hypothetical protein
MTDPSLRREPKPIPPELDHWNWGAFLLSWIWGIGNNTFIALLTLVPFFGILIMPFVLGAKGSRWAWRNGRWDDVAHFKRVQRLWAIWGAVIWMGAIVWFGVLFGGIFYSLKNSEAYAMAASRLQASAEAATALGTPISTGFPWGSVSVGGGSGRATLTFSATGPKAQGRVFVDAIREAGVWSIRSLMLRVDGRDGVIDLLRGRSVRLEGRRRFARLCPGHPRLCSCRCVKDVDAPDKPGHDGISG